MTGRLRRDERGLVLVWMAMLLVVLLGMAGFSVDLGFWYLRSAKLQRAADAAALAGVVWMPGNPTAAQAAAVATLEKNGIDTTKVSVSYPPPNTAQQFRVQLTDADVPSFFSRPMVPRVSETRSATGEYVTPVPMGSPRNVFGTGSLLASPNTENFWAAINGWCAGRENGDLRQAGKDRTFLSGQWTCGPNLPDNPDFSADGYLYAVDFASAPGQPVTIEIYDPAFSNSTGLDLALRGTPTFSTRYTVYDRTPTPFNPPSTVLATTSYSGSTGKGAWVSLYTIPNPKAGRYYLRVTIDPTDTSSSYGSNGFGLRARVGSTFSVCSTISSDPGYSPSCPQVHGVDDMSIYASIPSSAGTPSFYLAQVEAVHAGKTMKIDLFDPGEGASRMEILDPNGSPVSFDWTTPCGTVNGVTIAAPSGASCNSSTKTAGSNGVGYLDVSGTGTQPYSNLSSTSKYNDRTISVYVDLPANYSSLYGTKTWWKIRYTPGSAPTDRTTWSVSILGNPVHLVTEK